MGERGQYLPLYLRSGVSTRFRVTFGVAGYSPVSPEEKKKKEHDKKDDFFNSCLHNVLQHLLANKVSYMYENLSPGDRGTQNTLQSMQQ